MTPSGRARRGVTLLELLVVTTLAGLLSLGILYSMRIGLHAMERTHDRLLSNRRVVGAQRALENQMAGLIPVSFRCGAPTAVVGSIFFQGEPNGMRFISSYSLQEAARGYPRILEYLVIPTPAGARLVVTERHYTGPLSILPLCAGAGVDGTGAAMLQPLQLTGEPFVLADRLAFCRLSYLIVNRATRQRAWLPRFIGNAPPEAVRIEMAPMMPDPARLGMTAMTLPVRVERFGAETYVDIEEE